MHKVSMAKDMSGREVEKGDTVCTINGQTSGKIAELAEDETTAFVRLRPVHQPYGPAVWHAADRVLWQADGKQKKQRLREEAAAAEAAQGQGTEGNAAPKKTTSGKSAKSTAEKAKATTLPRKK